MTILKHEMKSNKKSLIIWSIAIGVMIFGSMLLFPMMEEALIEMGEMFSDIAGLSAAFGMDRLSIYSPMGYYGTQVGIMLSLGGALFAALLGSGVLSKEEGGHTAEFLLTTPISRANIIFQKVGAVFVIIFIFNFVCFVSATLSFVFIKETITMPEFLLYHLAQFYLHLEIACICFGLSAFVKKTNVGMGLGIAAILYFIDIMVKTVSDLEFLKYLTPFYYAGAADIFTNGKIDSVLLLIGFMVSVIGITMAFLQYSRKDIAA